MVEAAPTDMVVVLFPADDGLTGVVEYAADLFDPATIERWFDDWRPTLAE